MEKLSSGSAPTPEFSDDMLRSAAEISTYLFGSPEQRRRVYHLAATSRLPVFRLGSLLCARRSTLLEWIAEQEQRGWKPNG